MCSVSWILGEYLCQKKKKINKLSGVLLTYAFKTKWELAYLKKNTSDSHTFCFAPETARAKKMVNRNEQKKNQIRNGY